CSVRQGYGGWSAGVQYRSIVRGFDPGLRLGIGRRADVAALEDRAPGVSGDNRVGVSECDRRGVRVGAVEEELDRRGAAGREVAAEAGRDDEDGPVAPAAEPANDIVAAVRARGHAEVAACGEGVDQRAARASAVLVEDGEPDLPHVPVDGVAEEDEEEDGEREGEDHAPRVASELDRLLAGDGKGAAEAEHGGHPSTAPPVRRTRAT